MQDGAEIQSWLCGSVVGFPETVSCRAGRMHSESFARVEVKPPLLRHCYEMMLLSSYGLNWIGQTRLSISSCLGLFYASGCLSAVKALRLLGSEAR